MASTAVSTVPYAVITTRSVSGRSRFISLSCSSPESAPPAANGDYPFDLNGAPAVNALVNWQVFDRNELLQEARYGLVASILGLEYVSPGVTLGCWSSKPETDFTVENAQYTDQTLLLWRLPVQTHLVDAGNCVQGTLDRVGDLGFHLLRSGTGIIRSDRDGRQVDLWKAVNAQRKKAKPTDNRQKQDDHGRENRAMNTYFG